MWFAIQENGFRGWFVAIQDFGILREGLTENDVTITVINHQNTEFVLLNFTESIKSGVYFFDIPASFFIEHGPGHYAASIEVDTTVENGSGEPIITDVLFNLLEVRPDDIKILKQQIAPLYSLL